ncbi:hypothetical protein ACJX0J_028893, partial [Zea mays]
TNDIMWQEKRRQPLYLLPVWSVQRGPEETESTIILLSELNGVSGRSVIDKNECHLIDYNSGASSGWTYIPTWRFMVPLVWVYINIHERCLLLSRNNVNVILVQLVVNRTWLADDMDSELLFRFTLLRPAALWKDIEKVYQCFLSSNFGLNGKSSTWIRLLVN